MKKRRWVAVCNNSLYMAGIAASLKTDPTLEIRSVNIDPLKDRQILFEDDIVAIIFDLCDVPACLDITFFLDHPGLLLIGVNLLEDEMIVFSSHPAQAHSTADLVNVIHQKGSATGLFYDENYQKNYQQ
jgi:hypothetical protein